MPDPNYWQAMLDLSWITPESLGHAETGPKLFFRTRRKYVPAGSDAASLPHTVLKNSFGPVSESVKSYLENIRNPSPFTLTFAAVCEP